MELIRDDRRMELRTRGSESSRELTLSAATAWCARRLPSRAALAPRRRVVAATSTGPAPATASRIARGAQFLLTAAPRPPPPSRRLLDPAAAAASVHARER